MRLILAILAFVLVLSCITNKYEDYTPAIVVSSVEYDGRPVTMGCKGDFKCDKGTLECVYHFHKEAQNNIDNVKNLVELGRENIPIVTELYNALCNLYEVKSHIVSLRMENKEDWDILEKAGFIRQVSIVSSILVIKIRQLENAHQNIE